MIQDAISGALLGFYYSVAWWIWLIGGLILLAFIVMLVARLFGMKAARHTAFGGLAAIAALVSLNRAQRQGWAARERKIEIERRRAQRTREKIERGVEGRAPADNRDRLKQWRPKP